MRDGNPAAPYTYKNPGVLQTAIRPDFIFMLLSAHVS